MTMSAVLARATASSEAAGAEEASVNSMSTSVEPNAAEYAHKCLDQLAHEHEDERQIHQGEDGQDDICDPLAGFVPNRNLSQFDSQRLRGYRDHETLTVGVKMTSSTAMTIRATQNRKLMRPMLAP